MREGLGHFVDVREGSFGKLKGLEEEGRGGGVGGLMWCGAKTVVLHGG